MIDIMWYLPRNVREPNTYLVPGVPRVAVIEKALGKYMILGYLDPSVPFAFRKMSFGSEA